VTEEQVPLDLLEPAALHRRAVSVALSALVVAAALGGVVGLVGGRGAGLIAAVVVGLPLLVLALSESRRRTWLVGTVLVVRAVGTRRVDLNALTDLNILITDARGVRTMGMLASGGRRSKTVNVALGMYSGASSRELGIVPLRRLADALASTGDTRALVVSELLVGQLRAEARGDAIAEHPLYRLASIAPQRRLAQKLHPESVARFVTTLD
jgi:hypothetical protein